MNYFLKWVFYSRFVKISGLAKKFLKIVIFWPNFPIFGFKKNLRGWGVKSYDFSDGGRQGWNRVWFLPPVLQCIQRSNIFYVWGTKL